MKRFIEGVDRDQGTLFPECLADWIDEDNAVRVIDGDHHRRLGAGVDMLWRL